MKAFKRNKRLLVHVYVAFTLLAVLIWFLEPKIAQLFFTIGAGSPYWAFYIFCSATVGFWGGILSLLWFSLYPLFLLFSYFFAIKKRGCFFYTMVALDAIAVMIIGVYTITTNNLYGFKQVLPDIIVSMSFLLLLVICSFNPRKSLNAQGEEQNESPTKNRNIDPFRK